MTCSETLVYSCAKGLEAHYSLRTMMATILFILLYFSSQDVVCEISAISSIVVRAKL